MLFDIDAAAISLVFDGANSGTLGSSGAPARMYDELQFTLGEGPCLDSVARRGTGPGRRPRRPRATARWPVYGPAMLDLQVRGVFAMPVVVAGEYVGALDLFRAQPGQLDGEQFAGAIVAAELAGIPLLDLLDARPAGRRRRPGQQRLGRTARTVAAPRSARPPACWSPSSSVEPAEALVRLRAHAYATGRSATDVARDILDRRLRLEAD